MPGVVPINFNGTKTPDSWFGIDYIRNVLITFVTELPDPGEQRGSRIIRGNSGGQLPAMTRPALI